MLDDAGFENTHIVAADGGWNIAEDILTNPNVAKAVDIIG